MTVREPDLQRLIGAANQFAAVDLPDWLDALTDDPSLTLPEAAQLCAQLMAKVEHVREVLLAAQLDMRDFVAARVRSQAAGDETRVAGAPGSNTPQGDVSFWFVDKWQHGAAPAGVPPLLAGGG